VIGTHGRGGLDRALLGSVTDRVIRLAPCPVVTVRDTE
jgi:nucleotide-binding universal stress UspA family protein